MLNSRDVVKPYIHGLLPPVVRSKGLGQSSSKDSTCTHAFVHMHGRPARNDPILCTALDAL